MLSLTRCCQKTCAFQTTTFPGFPFPLSVNHKVFSLPLGKSKPSSILVCIFCTLYCPSHFKVPPRMLLYAMHNQPKPTMSPNQDRLFFLTESSGRCCHVAAFSLPVECGQSVSPSTSFLPNTPPPRSTCPDPFHYSSVQYSLLWHA